MKTDESSEGYFKRGLGGWARIWNAANLYTGSPLYRSVTLREEFSAGKPRGFDDM